MEIKIDQIGKRFLHGWVFRNLNYTFRNSTVYGIAGRNGSGKSTFLKIISGLLTASEGKIIYEDFDQLIRREDIYRQVNIAAPYSELIEEYTLEELIQFHSQFKSSSLIKSTHDWIELMELRHAASRPVNQFSSGMKQRVKLGLAMYSDGKILILDEPTSNLDEKAKAWFLYHHEKTTTGKVVLIASNESEDFKLAREVIRLDSVNHGVPALQV